MSVNRDLIWLKQMGVKYFADENPHALLDLTSVENEEKIASKLSLAKTAQCEMKGVGKMNPLVMCVLLAPTNEEDKTGVVFSGSEGEYTKRMLSSIGLDIETNTYVTYLSPWRPPGNRLLTDFETKECIKILQKRIREIRPKYLLLMGAPVVRSLLNKTINQIRFEKLEWNSIPVFGTFSASWLQKNTTYRRQAWEDLKNFKSFIGL